MLEKQIAKIIVSLTVLPNILGVLLGLMGVSIPISLLGLLVALFISFNLKNSQYVGLANSSNSIIFLIIYILFFISTYQYTCSKVASVEKIVNIAYLLLSPMLILVYAYRRPHNDKIIENYFVIILSKYTDYILILLSILMALGFTTESADSDRLCIIGMIDSIWCSRYIGFLVIIPILKIFNKQWGLLDALAILSALYIMMSSGSRGPILALLITIGCNVFPKAKFKYKIILCLFIAVIAIIFIHYSDRSSSGSTMSSNLARVELIQGVLDAEFNPIWGIGIGGFNVFITGEDKLYYPHNMFLETYLEAGIVGVILLFVVLYNVYKHRKYTYFAMFCLYFFINSMLSGDITGNNYFFIFAAVLLLCRTNSISIIQSK